MKVEQLSEPESVVPPHMIAVASVQRAHALACSTKLLAPVLSSWFTEFESLVMEGPAVLHETLIKFELLIVLSQIDDLLVAYLSLQLSAHRPVKEFLKRYACFLDLNKVFEICVVNHICEECCSRLGKEYCPTVSVAEALAQPVTIHIESSTIDSALTLLGRNPALIFHFLPTLTMAHASKTVLVAAAQYPLVTPWMVRGVLLSREAVRDAATDDASHGQNLYLNYLVALLKQNRCRANAKVVTEFFDLCLATNQPKGVFREEQDTTQRWWWQEPVTVVPSVGCHRIVWKHQALLLEVLQNPAVYRYEDQRLARACAKFGFVKGLQILYLRSSAPAVTSAALSLALLTQDVDFLLALMDKQLSPFVGDPKDAPVKFEHWRTLLIRCKDSGGIDFWVVVKHMTTLLGSYLALFVLLQSGVLRDEQLSASVYADFLTSWELQEKQRSLGLHLLETIDTHLWQTSSPALSAPLRAALRHEQSVQQKLKSLHMNLNRALPVEEIAEVLSIQSDVLPERSNGEVHAVSMSKVPHGEYASHWGVHVNLTPNVTCVCCGMRIKICESTSAADALRTLCLDGGTGSQKGEQDAWDGREVRTNKQKEDDGISASPDDTPYQTPDHNKLGATAFRCGHVFHRSCLSEQACAVCFDGLFA